MKYAQITVDEKVYNLKLTLDKAVQLEDDLGKNPLMIFACPIPKLKDMRMLFNYSLEIENNQLLQEWLNEGHTVQDLSSLCMDILRASGFVQQKDDDEKN